jgi:hypothetical protein
LFGAPQGKMENDFQHHIKSEGVAPHTYIHIPVTADQAIAIQAAIKARGSNPGGYNLLFRNCAQAVESFLHAGGISGIPHGEAFIPAVLHAMLQER